MDFRDILAERSVFYNRDALSPHFLPERMLHREKEIERIMRAMTPIFYNKKPKNVFLYGKTGTGKTSSIKYIAKQFAQMPSNGAIVYVNCRLYNTKYKILQKTASDMLGFTKNGFPPSVFYEKIAAWIQEKSKHLVLILDEIDIVKDLDELIYMLTRANDDLKVGSISAVGISNRLDFKRQLEPRSKSALLETEIVFPPYNSEQLREILLQRAKIGFNDGTFELSAVNLAGAIAARETGDARYALKLLTYAGEIADERHDDVVTHTHVELARKVVEEDIVVEAISTLPEHQQIVLYALALLTSQGSKYTKLTDEAGHVFMSGELYEMYKNVCKKLRKEERSSRWCKEYLRELEALGLVQMVESGKGVRGHSTLIQLACSPDKVKKAVEDILL